MLHRRKRKQCGYVPDEYLHNFNQANIRQKREMEACGTSSTPSTPHPALPTPKSPRGTSFAKIGFFTDAVVGPLDGGRLPSGDARGDDVPGSREDGRQVPQGREWMTTEVVSPTPVDSLGKEGMKAGSSAIKVGGGQGWRLGRGAACFDSRSPKPRMHTKQRGPAPLTWVPSSYVKRNGYLSAADAT